MSWFVSVTLEEAASVGLSVGSHINKWGDLIKPIFMSKGVPERFLTTGSLKCRPCYQDNPLSDDMVFEVDDE